MLTGSTTPETWMYGLDGVTSHSQVLQNRSLTIKSSLASYFEHSFRVEGFTPMPCILSTADKKI